MDKQVTWRAQIPGFASTTYDASGYIRSSLRHCYRVLTMAISDKALGAAMIFVALFVFVYYTSWALLLPFLDKGNPAHDLFPPREWAVRLPAFLFVVGLAAVGAFFGSTIIKENRRKAQKARLRTA